MLCPACKTQLPDDASFCHKCGHALTAWSADAETVEKPTGDATGGLIPYKNQFALIAYYCGIFSLMPCIGLLPGIVGLVLGIKGYKAYKKTPVIRGAVHAWIGIIFGGLSTLVWGGFLLWVGISALMHR